MKRIPRGPRDTRALVAERWQLLGGGPEARAALADESTLAEMARFERNIENFIGTVKVPAGIAGPLRVAGSHARGDYFIPLATTEATLVASYSRGAQLISEAGGCATAVLAEGVSRSPGFAFRTLAQAARFASWIESQVEALAAVAAGTTSHGRLGGMRATVEGNHVYVNLEFCTGEAAGQNMVTIATAAILRHIAACSPVKHEYCFLEANHSGDKKASAHSLGRVRGKRVSAEVRIPRSILAERLHASPERMTDYWRMAALGGVLSGTIGVQGQFANGLAAFYIACGQDAACVAESAVGVTRLEIAGDGGLYASVTLPNVIVGAVGGGTGLPSQRACIEILRRCGPADTRALAEVCAALALSGELSLIGAMCSGDFARAHAGRARGINLPRQEIAHA
ncbi:MAG: hydroxymethylglutaryl-CoA reductase [Burkholderiales bacterium]